MLNNFDKMMLEFKFYKTNYGYRKTIKDNSLTNMEIHITGNDIKVKIIKKIHNSFYDFYLKKCLKHINFTVPDLISDSEKIELFYDEISKMNV